MVQPLPGVQTESSSKRTLSTVTFSTRIALICAGVQSVPFQQMLSIATPGVSCSPSFVVAVKLCSDALKSS